MKTQIKTTKEFDKEAKRLQKKYPSLAHDLSALVDSLYQKPKTGTSLGSNTYKIRLAIASKGKGKSGGARVITHVDTELIATHITHADYTTTIHLLTIYDKSEVGSVSTEMIKRLIALL